MRAEGTADIPTDPEQVRDLLGVGWWWKYDPDEAAKLLKSVGFKKIGDKWQTPEGRPWTISILAPADFEVESQRLAFAVANAWTAFGIDAKVNQMQDGPFFSSEARKLYQVGSYWGSSCGMVPDPFVRMEGWHKDYVRPNGQPSSSNAARYVDDTLSLLIDKLRVISSDDPQVVPLGIEILKELVTGLPAIEMFGTSKFVPVNERLTGPTTRRRRTTMKARGGGGRISNSSSLESSRKRSRNLSWNLVTPRSRCR